MKKYVDIQALENYYRSQIKKEDGKEYVSIALLEKIMLLEIYKALCKGGDERKMVDFKAVRKSKRLTVQQTAERLGIPKRTYESYENRERQPSVDFIERFCQTFEVSVADLFQEPKRVKEKVTCEELNAVCVPAMKLLREKGDPMMMILITSEGAELLSGECGIEKRSH